MEYLEAVEAFQMFLVDGERQLNLLVMECDVKLITKLPSLL